jgi:hypothetical protein
MLNSKEITIEVTNICGANCVTCPREKFNQKLGVMPFDLFKKIIDDAFYNGYTSLDTCGFGDPLLDPFLKRRFEYVKNKYPSMLIYTSSTCYMLSEDKIDLLVEFVDTLKISIYGHSNFTYQKLHNLDSYEKAKENILKLVKRRANKQFPYLIGLMLLLPENKHEMKDWINFWEPKLDEVIVWQPHNWIGARNYREKTIKRKTCGRPINGNLTVGVDGKVSICCFDFNKTVTIGNLCTQTIEEIKKNSIILKEIVQMHKGLAFDDYNYLCKDCDQTFDANQDILVYSTCKERKPGVVTSHKNFNNNMLKDLENNSEG